MRAERARLEQPVELMARRRRDGRPSSAPCARREPCDVVGEARDRLREVVRVIAGGDDRVEEAAEHALHHRADEIVAVIEVHVEGAAREAGARADGVEARLVEAVLGELRDAGEDQGLAGLALADGAGGRELAHET
jgi:hypothetical protein